MIPRRFVIAAAIVSTCVLALSAPSARAEQSVIVVIGAPGTDDYAASFRAWADNWRRAAAKGGAKFTLIGADANDPSTNDRDRLQQLLSQQPAATTAAAPANEDALWLILIGHGSFDGEAAKFNLRGPDLALADLAPWLNAVKSPVAVIDCTSASAPLINVASADGRVLIAATKSGYEQNYARFGQYIAAAIADPAADLDKDGQTSLLEAYLTACRGVAEFYDGDQRLATEHALLDDNGDGAGTPAAWFRGLRATQRAKEGAALDGLRAHQFHLLRSDREQQMPADVRTRRDALELAIAALRDRKLALDEDAYYAELEPLMRELANLYAALPQRE